MVGVLVDHDLIATSSSSPRRCCNRTERRPRRNCRTRSAPGFLPQARIHVASKATAEMSVCPRLSDMVMRIVGAAIMSDPSDRSWRQRAEHPDDLSCPRQRGSPSRQLLLTSCRRRSACRLGSPRGSRTVSGNVSTANRRGVTAASAPPPPLSAQKQPGKSEPIAL